MNYYFGKNYRGIFYFLLVAFVLNLHAQEMSHQRGRDRNEWDFSGESPQIYFEPLHLIAEEDGKRRLDINYRIAFDFFVFVRNNEPSAAQPYVARADIAVEILDSNKISVARQIIRKELRTAETSDQYAEKKFLQGIFSFTLPPGRYTIVTEINDLESSRKYFDDKRTLTLKNDKSSSLFLSDAIFTEVVADRDSLGKLVPLNYGGDVPFGRNFDVYVELLCQSPLDALRGTFSLKKKNSELEEMTTLINDTTIVEKILPAKSLIVQSDETNYFYRIANSPVKNKYLLAVPLQGDTLEQGTYEMSISLFTQSDSISLRKQFSLRWVSMPLSLRSFERAVMPLKYIMEEKEFRKLNNEARRDRKKKFDEFWKSKDPTPKTTFNEAMAEFYRRVDYAAVNFATLREPDGIETDRGKAYILYGPPTKIDRALKPGSPPQEIWYYSHLNKKLIFLDESGKGDYKFISQEQL